MPRPMRRKTGVYWLRVRVPPDVQAQFGRKEAMRSLGTKDPEVAKVRLLAVLGELQAEWQRLREGPSELSPREISGLVGEHYRETVALAGQAHDATIWGQLDRVSEAHAREGALGRWYGPTADALLAKAGLMADVDSRQRLLQALYEADLKASGVNRRAAEGDFSPDQNLQRFAPMPVKAPPSAPKVTLTALLALWEREHKAVGGPEDTRTRWERVTASFTAYLAKTDRGHLVEDAARITPKDIADYADHLRHERGLKAKSINGQHLAALRSIYAMGVTKHVVPENPAKGASVAPERVVSTRSKGFTGDEAKAILSAALAAKDPVRRWVPWIAAYTGCRVSEIAQLRREDFMTEGGIPYFRVTPEAGSVKTGRYRPVPIHPHLVELGLLDFVAKAKGPRVFSAKSVQAIVAGFVREVLELPEGYTVAPNHAWRHRLKTLGREHGMDTAALDAFQGHAAGSEGGRYGEWTVAALYRELVKLPRYETT